MNGILNLNKPVGCTSFDCVAVLRRLTGEKRIGHTGTLDPQASGVLPICIGKATRLLEFMDDVPKTYVCGCTLGLTTDTLDIWGKTECDRRPLAFDLSAETVEKGLLSFQGEITQKPPVFSAIKVNGRKLYEYAREGRAVEVPERRVIIHSVRLLSWEGANKPFTFEVVCSRGTYVRSICRDLGELLGTGACMSSLVRTETCGYKLEDAASLDALKTLAPEEIEALLDPLETAAEGLPRLDLSDAQARLFAAGNPLWSEGLNVPEEPAAAFREGRLIGVTRDGRIAKVLL
ncbi:MAG: tRNA pseudouridine(55) synthase TruB [Clostridia bacterium]|nr:tRNA pseudouridine(55) synthase TruB [Clostridia bacterium]